MSDDPIAILRQRGAETEAELTAFLDGLAGVPPRLMEAIRYSLFAGGKRLRPTLVLEWANALGADETGREVARVAAGAIELIHTFSLVHDDLPAMDDDDLRRGRPTNHKVYGEAMAILAGDAMTTLAFEICTARAPIQAAWLVGELARASGPAGMIGGQAIDIENEHTRLALPDLQGLHAMKTGALITCACRLGAIAVDPLDRKSRDAATLFGTKLGLAFQIMDDVLDATATPEQMGKATGKDADAGKNTYPQLIGLDASRARAREALDAAMTALDGVRSPERLRALARFIVERQS